MDEADSDAIEEPTLSISMLGKRGRFGNQLFQYAFAKIYARKHQLRLETPDWIGRDLFGCNDPPLSRSLPPIFERTPQDSIKWLENPHPLVNVDFIGFHLIPTHHYAPERDYFRALYQPSPAIASIVKTAARRLQEKGKTLVGLHLRRGDFVERTELVAPSQWYREWLENLWSSLEHPILFIASDELDSVLADFADYHPVTVRDLGVQFPAAEFYLDFYLLSQCDAVAISNSTFSFAACLLNERGTLFVRPDRDRQQLLEFEPWNSNPTFNHLGPIYLIIFPDWQQEEDQLSQELSELFFVWLKHPQKDRITLLIDAVAENEERVNLLLTSATFSILLAEELTDDLLPEVFVIVDFNATQWQYLTAILDARLMLESENRQEIMQRCNDRLPAYPPPIFARLQATLNSRGHWVFA